MPPPILGFFRLACVQFISHCVEFGRTFPGIGNKTTYSLYRRTKRGVIEPEVGSGAAYEGLGVIAKRHCRPGNRHDLVGIAKTAKSIGARLLSTLNYGREVLKVRRKAHISKYANPDLREFDTCHTGVLYAMEVSDVGYICRLHALCLKHVSQNWQLVPVRKTQGDERVG